MAVGHRSVRRTSPTTQESMNPLREELGKIKTVLYRKPMAKLERLCRWGPNAYFRIEDWKRKMEQAARELPEPAAQGAEGKERSVDIWFMTGKGFWYQTAFCAWTLARHSRYHIRPVILDDGSLDVDTIDQLRRLFPDLIVHAKESCDMAFQERFPAACFPNLNFWRNKQLLFRKLTDIHGGSDERRIFLDSDMLFFRNPSELDEWFEGDQGYNLVQKDCWESYGYSRMLTERLCGRQLPEAVNIGIFSLHGPSIDWGQVEIWTGELIKAEGLHYNITQCTTAMIMACSPLRILDPEDYKVWPKNPSATAPQRVLDHYVSDSKPYYFGEAWKVASGNLQ